MKIKLIWIGKTNQSYLNEGISIYIKRLKHYTKLEIIEIKDIKNFTSKEDLKIKEGQALLSKLTPEDFTILLDEKGKTYSSVLWAKKLESFQNQGKRCIAFIIGGAFGFHNDVYKRANGMLALSNMTFSHQMIRLFFLEQLYRGYTIIKNEKYHNE